MSYIYNLTDTWSAGGTTFTAVKMNVTDTASAAGSLLMDLQVGGVSQASITKGGVLTVGSTIELGNASDTTLSRVSAGVVAVEGNTLATLSTAQTFTAAKTFDALRIAGLSSTGTNSALIRAYAPGAINDDTAVSTTALSGGQNGVGFFTNSAGNYVFFVWECTGTPSLTSISASANMALTTGVLNGTTGVDGNCTLSIDTATRILYLENRSGGAAILTLTLLGGT